jgi:hypothetical protein
MRFFAIGFALGTMLLAGSTLAAGPFDGTWKGSVPATGSGRGASCPEGTLTATITDGKMTGIHQASRYTFNFKGTVQADGTLVQGFMSSYPLTGKLTGNDFVGNYQSKECGVPRQVTLHRGG